MENNYLKVTFFGEFSLSYKGKLIMVKHNSNSKVYFLLKFLLANRGKGFSKEHLIDLLYDEQKTENPTNALKILVYRLRKEFVDSGLTNIDWIINSNGKYYWNPEAPCEIDIEIFEKLLNEASQIQITDNRKIENYINALNLYKGEFLGSNSFENWVIPIRVHYQQLYIQALKSVFDLLKEKKDFKLLLDISSRGAEIYSLDEEIAYEKIFSLKELDRIKEGINEYNQLVDNIVNEFGVAPSSQLSELYSEMKSITKNTNESLTDVKKYLDYEKEEEGAYYTNLENFSESYKIISRGLERSGLSGFLMLCTIGNKQGRTLEEISIKEASEVLKKATKNALRRGDLYTRYSQCQYLFLLIGIDQENCRNVFQRVEENFKRGIKNNPYTIKYKTISALEMSKLIK